MFRLFPILNHVHSKTPKAKSTVWISKRFPPRSRRLISLNVKMRSLVYSPFIFFSLLIGLLASSWLQLILKTAEKLQKTRRTQPIILCKLANCRNRIHNINCIAHRQYSLNFLKNILHVLA